MTTTYLATLADVGAGVPSGIAFPGSPTDKDLFYRTDLDLLFRYRSTGTRWVSVNLYYLAMGNQDAFWPLSATGTPMRAATSRGFGSDLYLERLTTTFYVSGGATALGASHKWVGTFKKVDPAESGLVTVVTVNIDSGSSGAYRIDDQAIGAVLGTAASYPSLLCTFTKTGTPGNLRVVGQELSYRIVAT